MSKPQGITMEVKIADTDMFSEFLDLVREFVFDDRVPQDVRDEFGEKLHDFTEGYRNEN